jgi:organic radical activating enzyme
MNKNCRNIVWTGGEPCLQLTTEHIEYFRAHGYYQAIETNGSLPIPKGFDWVTVSPKGNTHESILEVDELKYVIKDGDHLPETKIKAKHYFLSPMFEDDKIDSLHFGQAIYLCMRNPSWKMTLQNHKLWGIR